MRAMPPKPRWAWLSYLCGRKTVLARAWTTSWLGGLILAAAVPAAAKGRDAERAARHSTCAVENSSKARLDGRLASLHGHSAQALLAGGSLVGRFHGTEAAASGEGTQAIEDARQALLRAGRVPWYDAQHDTLRRLAIKPTPPPPRAGAPPAPPQSRTLSRTPPWLGPLLQGLGLCVLAGAICLVAVAMVTAFLRREQQETPTRKAITSPRAADRVASLPLPLRAAAADFLAEARRLAAEGRFSEAIVYLFSYELLLLDQHQLLRLVRGKTNRQYLRELRDRPALAAILERTMQTFEAAFFGHKAIPHTTFAACWQDLESLHAELAPHPPVAV